MQVLKKLLILLSSVAIGGCGIGTAEGGIGGAVIGAGAGAAIASQMSDGAIGASAALGAAIGLPAGVLMALAVNEWARPESEKEAARASSEIKSNQEEIYKNNQEIDELRREASEEAPIGNPPVQNRDKVFTGATLGNPLR